jgi:hypothetical protein
MEKLKPYIGQFLLMAAAVMAGSWAYDQLNKPKVVAPSTATATSGK